MKKHEVQPSSQMEAIKNDLHSIANWFHLGVVLPLETMEEWLKKGNYKKIKEMLPGLVIQSRSILNRTRKIQSGILRVSPSKNENFHISLKRLTRLWESRSGIKKHIKIDCPKRLATSDRVKQSLLTITDECFSNAIKHSGIITNPNIDVAVIVKNGKDFTTLEIIDSGRGAEKIIQGYGLKKIKRVISQLNRAGIASSIEIGSSINKGFKVKVSIRA